MDTDLLGFGVRLRYSGTKTYFVRYRTKDGARRLMEIGPHGIFTPDKARDQAKILLGQAAGGDDPAEQRKRSRQAQTVSDLCDQYLEDVEAGRVLTRSGRPKKATTLATDRGRIVRHIKPLLGKKRVEAVKAHDIERFRNQVTEGDTAADVKTGPRGRAIVKGGAGTASRTLGLLSGVFTYAIRKRLRTDNPVHGIERAGSKRNVRALSMDDYSALGAALREAEAQGVNPVALAAIEFLALSGCRKTEALSLRWSVVDQSSKCLRFPDTKIGEQVRPMGGAALDVLSRARDFCGEEYPFPASRGNGHFVGVGKVWKAVVKNAGLDDITLHGLRHGFASVAASPELGYSELVVAGLLGHRSGSVTARYVHLADPALIAAADRVSRAIAARMSGEAAGADVITLPRRGY